MAAINTTTTSSFSLTTAAATCEWTSNSYPPILNLAGCIDPKDRPFSQYCFTEKKVLARGFNFNNKLKDDRCGAMHMCATAVTDLPLDSIGNHVLKRPGFNGKIYYICVSRETDKKSGGQRVFVQLLFNHKVNTGLFLDSLSPPTTWTYQFVHDDLILNEYMKKDTNFIECGQFKSLKKFTDTETTWLDWLKEQLNIHNPNSKKNGTRKMNDVIAIMTINLAKQCVYCALDFLEREVPMEYLTNLSIWRKRCFDVYELVCLRKNPNQLPKVNECGKCNLKLKCEMDQEEEETNTLLNTNEVYLTEITLNNIIESNEENNIP